MLTFFVILGGATFVLCCVTFAIGVKVGTSEAVDEYWESEPKEWRELEL